VSDLLELKEICEGQNGANMFMGQWKWFFKEAAKAECVITFLDNFIFLCAIHEKHDFKYLKNPMVKFVKYGAMMSIICHSGCPNYQITAIVFLFSDRFGKGEGWFEFDST
jgi:hypothetical protein